MIFLQIAAFEAHKQRRSMTVKENVHIRLNVHGSAFECPGKHSIKFRKMNFVIAADVVGQECPHNVVGHSDRRRGQQANTVIDSSKF